ncbi:methyltransferase [Actinoplanes derwentensis]|uniref:methyltransferase n=1 Tax=Actinoplanes derwentensis TaxID=113562 RepID=UPI000B88C6B5|nr:methyltransferase [Actinoplanes derwentensis]
MTLARYLCLLIPLVALLAAARANPRRAGAALAFTAAATGIAALHEVSSWYTFAAVDGSYRGMPVDLWLGWAVLWGPIPVLLRRHLPLPVALGLLLWIDAIAMPALEPLVVLGPHWLTGDILGLLLIALPAQLLGRWTDDRRHLILRVLLQMAVFTALVMWLAPSVAYTFGDGGWQHLRGLPAEVRFLLAQAGLVVALPALAAVREFAIRGDGTPFPWDPPQKIITTGPYAYLANPMQLSAVLLLLLLAAVTHSTVLAAAAVTAVAFSAAVAGPHEEHDMARRYGEQWRAYRRHVRDWWPSPVPYRASTPATVWLDDDCGPCRAFRDALNRRNPVNLTIRPAADHERTLWRARYEAADGYTVDGVGAVARALEHTSLLPAYASWLLLLPVFKHLAQLVTDALIAPPHPALRQNERQ